MDFAYYYYHMTALSLRIFRRFNKRLAGHLCSKTRVTSSELIQTRLFLLLIAMPDLLVPLNLGGVLWI
jgi:hypothetical protein